MNIKAILITACLPVITSCTSIDQRSLRATSDIPEVAKTDLFEAPYDSSKPKLVIAVAPFYLRSSISERNFSNDYSWEKNESGSHNHLNKTQRGLQERAAQKTLEKGLVQDSTGDISSKSGSMSGQMYEGKEMQTSEQYGKNHNSSKTSGKESSNIEYINYGNVESAQKITAQLVSALGRIKNFQLIENTNRAFEGRKPLVVKGVITEFTEVVESSSDKLNLLTIYEDSDIRRTGVVGLDIKVVDPSDGSIKAAFPVKTSFSSQEKSNSVGLLIDIAKSKKFAQSALDQAVRQALYETSFKLHEELLN